MERYEDKVAKAFGGQHKVTDRQQLYQNSAGYQKAGHERSYDNAGRKVVYEKAGTGEERYQSHYKNLEECNFICRSFQKHDLIAKAETFDREWQSMAQSLGLRTNTMGHALPYGSSQPREIRSHVAAPQITYDDQRHGVYVPSSIRNESNPVHFSRPPYDPRIEPLQPAIPSALPLPAPPQAAASNNHPQRAADRPRY